MLDEIADSELPRLNDFVAEAMGLTFPPQRWPDLRRGIARAAQELGFDDATECAQWFIAGKSTKAEIETLASHLTVGETYFFREKRSFEILADHILPQLVQMRRNRDRQLRIWSAACCTGEEPYSIAMVIQQVIPDWRDWRITLLASDINSRFLSKASAGVYGEWSFRNAPAGLKERYFHRNGNGQFEIIAPIKEMVRFARVNLAEDVYPSSENETNAMDVIFCRNVLMYFTHEQAGNVIRKLHGAQADGGWLIVGPSELLNVSHGPFAPAKIHGVTLYQKRDAEDPHPQTNISQTAKFSPVARCRLPAPVPASIAVDECDSKRVERPAPSQSKQIVEPTALPQLAYSLAGQGKWSEAIACCDKWIAADRLNASCHYLRAVILQEKGAVDDAVHSLRRALYLDPDCMPAHFAMGNIARNRGDFDQSIRHLKNARKLLRRYKPGDILPEFEGITAGRFTQIVNSLIERRVAV